jgi:hypothetical protein
MKPIGLPSRQSEVSSGISSRSTDSEKKPENFRSQVYLLLNAALALPVIYQLLSRLCSDSKLMPKFD